MSRSPFRWSVDVNVTITVRAPRATFGASLMLACPIARARALEAAEQAADAAELERTTDLAAGALPRGDGAAWRWRTRWLAGQGDTSRASLAAACGLAPDDDDTTTDTRN